MLTRADLEAREEHFLAPYATRSAQARRIYLEGEAETRTAFQKDRDRVLHTTAFRRLEAKTQVFLNPQGDHYRTRLTHTLEVQQVARSVALTLGLNETLAETMALAHDLGHPPFGHAGERLLDTLMAGEGGFNHNVQSRRIVTHLEDRYPNFPGLNLTLATLDGLNKHNRAGLGQPSLEAQVVDAADALAYTAHDLDDGLRSGLMTAEQLSDLPLWTELRVRTGITSTALTSQQRRTLHRELLGWLITDLTETTAQHLQESGVQSPEEIRQHPHKLVAYSPAMRVLLTETGHFLRQNLYRHWQVEMQVEQADRVLKTLFGTFTRRPGLLPPRPQARIDVDGLPRAVCDHIAGMTDRYALDIYARLVPPLGR
ncbi:deoxyguanosinetriphosphate triphosphohydrolase [Deinococcus fonticola]|uniref:deoxyguanosinetriphosphate triphosphohydrolase n=1 Tax=Deinococcus fonticola TaxID=2528713 RepID=UPI001075782F|nr:deoxyguanosinetriphosphate triphosphohydrolase [Deinococcus fonticola]